MQSPDKTFTEIYAGKNYKLSKRLVRMNWTELFPSCIRIMQRDSAGFEQKAWVRSFHRFLDQEYEMKAYSTEAWILAISTKPLWSNGMSHWDIHQKHRVWWDYKEHTVRPLYLAFRVKGKLDSIYRVSGIEYGIPIIDKVPEMPNIKKKWPKTPCTIWHFEPPVKLPVPLRTGSGMYNRRVRCDFDLLLSCKTVLEVEQAMKKRKS